MGNFIPTVWIQRHGSITSAPSSDGRPSKPRRRSRRPEAISADARTRASQTNQAMVEVCQIVGAISIAAGETLHGDRVERSEMDSAVTRAGAVRSDGERR